jgi:predicted DNA-binding ribbon-helix-helix protein
MRDKAVHYEKPSAVVKRGVWISGRSNSVRLEDEFWHALGEIAEAKDTTRPRLLNKINQARSHANLSSAVRLFVLAYYQGSAK